MIRFTFVTAFAVCLFAISSTQAAEPVTTEGRVTAVTVYQGQALVTRDVEIESAEGLLEVVVTGLPESVLPGSLFAEPSGDVQVRSVRYRARPIEADVRQEVRELDEQIQAVADKLAAVIEERTLLNERKSYLDKLKEFTAGTATQELKSGVLNAETLKSLTEFMFAERDEIGQRELELAKEERTHNQEIELLKRKRETVAAGSARTAREAVVFINAPAAGAAKLRLSYLVGNASWTPSYNLRATEARDAITVEYNASIQQMSGEDWNDVEMVLSTATPSLIAKAPKLEVLAIKLGAPVQIAEPMVAAENYFRMQQNIDNLSKMRGKAVMAQQAANAPATVGASIVNGRISGMDGGGGYGGGVGGWDFAEETKNADAGLNDYACQLQLMDFNNSLSSLRREDNGVKLAEGVSVSYKLANSTSLPSRSDRQLIQIASVPLKGDFYRLATPVLTSFVYEEARLTNTSDQVFLAGPVATFLGGQFVGRGEMPTVAVGESFVVGLGIDSSLRAERQLVKKEERIQGGNRVVDFIYELKLENFGDKAATVRLLDRLPTVGENDIKVTLVRSDEKVSEDEAYQMNDRKDGILRWDVEVPAQAVGPQRKVLKYTMQIEYDKQLSIEGMPAKR
ncbi:MAG: mucoidy inhibitor MuiA family protein [Bythopirellula sp.]|nr:mucoidy inhibitor MuiA family protein [Bythopirellula sp.]